MVYRHEIAEAAGLISQAFGTEEVDRHIVLFKKVTWKRFHMLAHLIYFVNRSIPQLKLSCRHFGGER